MAALLLKALKGQNADRPPVWIMRQAGRTLPPYQKLRESHSLGALFRTPELAAHVTCMPIELLGVDAAILFSDILLLWELFGLAVHYPQKGAPVIEGERAGLDRCEAGRAEERLAYVKEAAIQAKKGLNVPLIGFAGGPFTLLSFLLTKEKVVDILHDAPAYCHALLQKLADATIDYLQMQIEAGADVLQLFESHASLLSEKELEAFSLPYLGYIIEGLRSSKIPIILFAKGSSAYPQKFAALGADALSFDWHRPLWELRKEIPSHLAVQGNFDPALLQKKPEEILKEVQLLKSRMRGDSGWIANLGHGVLPDTPFTHVRCFVDGMKLAVTT